jgi:hypothetical protein
MNKPEILKLKDLLVDADIPFDLHEQFDGYQICYPNTKNLRCSVIEFNGSYGYEGNLLEIMGLLTEEERRYDTVAGSLTAEDVFGRIKEDYRHNSGIIKSEGEHERTD